MKKIKENVKCLNARHSVECLKASEVLTRLEKEDKLRIISAMYDIESGEVIYMMI